MPQQFLDGSEVGAGVHQVRRETVPERVRADLAVDPAHEDRPVDNALDRPRGQTPAAPADKDGIFPAPFRAAAADLRPFFKVLPQCPQRGPAHGHDPLLPALPPDPHQTLAVIDILQIQTGQFAKPNPRGIEKLHDRPVSQPLKSPAEIGRKNRHGIIHRQKGGNVFLRPRGLYQVRRIGADLPLAQKIAEKRPEGSHLAADGHFFELFPVKRAHKGPDHEMIDPGDSIFAPRPRRIFALEKIPELLQINEIVLSSMRG